MTYNDLELIIGDYIFEKLTNYAFIIKNIYKLYPILNSLTY